MNPLREAAQQALEALETGGWNMTAAALRAALAQQAEPDLSRCPQCNGPADNGFDRSFPPSPYLCTKCMAEPVPGAWVASPDGRVIYDDASTDDGLLRVSGDFENDEQRSRYAQRIVDKLNAALAQQDEPDHETRAELAEQQVVQLAEERDHYRNLWQKAQEQAEPLNLSDPAVRKRLASQWGYVPAAAQAEPVQEPVAWIYQNIFSGRDYLFWKKEGGGENWKPLYTATPQRTMVPLTEEEIKTAFHAARNAKLGASQDNSRHRLSVIEIARAVEKASWEKNNG